MTVENDPLDGEKLLHRVALRKKGVTHRKKKVKKAMQVAYDLH
jgi:hypothetical protein